MVTLEIIFVTPEVPLFATPKLAKKVLRKRGSVAKRGCCEKGDLRCIRKHYGLLDESDVSNLKVMFPI